MRTTRLPFHPTKRHPLTGQPLQAIWIRPDGKVCWPVMGGDETNDNGGQGGSGGDLGFPANTPVAQMTDPQRAAYWQHQAQKHEGRVKNLAGDRPFDEVKRDLEAYAEIQRSQQTPAEQALQQRYDQGKADATAESNTKAARAIFRANLIAQGYADDASEDSDLSQALAVVDVSRFIKDGDIDTALVASTAQRLSPSGSTRNTRSTRDFGGGRRGGSGSGAPGAAGSAEADKRFGAPKQ